MNEHSHGFWRILSIEVKETAAFTRLPRYGKNQGKTIRFLEVREFCKKSRKAFDTVKISEKSGSFTFLIGSSLVFIKVVKFIVRKIL